MALNPTAVTVTAFFALCQKDPSVKTLLYSEISSYYTWNASRKSFERRKRDEPVEGQPGTFKETTIGRLYTVHLNQDECFFLRTLLVNVPGPTSFQQIKIVSGVADATFRSAYQALNLLESDRHWDVSELWEKYKSYTAEDILHRIRSENSNMNMDFTAEIYNEALIMIED
ncbi:unnamed protein product, partial [Onchocerca ochengi]|uniref:DUF4065 domain-containing protein n=1 Tax=Onchocerca ochengi TaxID=42157 RepID=A0A182ELT2_ONCOC